MQTKGKPLASDIAIPNTGGWQAWENVTVNELKLDTGVQVIRLTIGATGSRKLGYDLNGKRARIYFQT